MTTFSEHIYKKKKKNRVNYFN